MSNEDISLPPLWEKALVIFHAELMKGASTYRRYGNSDAWSDYLRDEIGGPIEDFLELPEDYMTPQKEYLRNILHQLIVELASRPAKKWNQKRLEAKGLNDSI